MDPRVRDAVSRSEWREHAPTNAQRAVVLAEPADGPGIIAVHTGEHGSESADWFADALEAAATVALGHGGRYGPARPLPLVAFPLLGTGAGGAAGHKGSVLQGAARSRGRRCRAWPGPRTRPRQRPGLQRGTTDSERGRRSDRLAPRVGLGGAGARGHARVACARRKARRVHRSGSRPGSGPSRVVGAAGRRSGRPPVSATSQVGELNDMDPRDAGDVLQQRLGGAKALDQALRQCFDSAERGSLSHALLASLPMHEAATTNYDRLFERAWGAAIAGPGRSARGAVTVLPRENAAHAQHWLLKLHGDVDDPNRNLVLSRDEYGRFERAGGAVAGVLQAMLLTRHLLIVGYRLQDETFHRIVHEVREVRASPVQTRCEAPIRRGRRAARHGTARDSARPAPRSLERQPEDRRPLPWRQFRPGDGSSSSGSAARPHWQPCCLGRVLCARPRLAGTQRSRH